MCNLYNVSPKSEFEVYIRRHAADWRVPDFEIGTVGPNQAGVFVRPDGTVSVGQWGMIRPGQPERIDYLPSKAPGKRGRPRSTNNARIETVASRPTFKAAWSAGQRCLVPASWYQEPNWETGKNVWWHLKRADGAPWMLAGLWSEWTDPVSGEIVPNYTMITRNCTGHPLLGRLHRPEVDPKTGEELPPEKQDKRSVVHVDPADWDRWLNGSEDDARSLIELQPPEVFDQADALRTDELLAALNR